MYRERNFITVLGGVILGIFAINNLFTDAVNTAQNLKHLGSWGKQAGLDVQILSLIQYVILLLNAYFPVIIFFGFLILILCKR
jgi:hypothetical protein